MRRLRLASHIHTHRSDDSDWGLERLVRVLRRAGFHGALVCDHDRTMDDAGWRALQLECDRVGNDRRFVLIPGIEYQDPDHVVHLPVFGRAPFYGRSPVIGEVLRRVRGDGGAAVFAHPARREAWRRFEPAWATGLSGVEVWNRKYDGIRPGTWATAAAREHGIPSFTALDWHGPRQLYPLAMSVPAPPAGRNGRRGDDAVASLLEGRGVATAFGMGVDRFDRGILGRATRTLESSRRWIAPHLRRLESEVSAR